MDIRPIPMPVFAHAAPPPDPGAGAGPNPSPAETEHRVVPAEKAEKAAMDGPSKMPTGPSTRVELHIDEATNRVFGRVVNRNTGEPVREIPAEELRNLQAHVQQLVRTLLDETA